MTTIPSTTIITNLKSLQRFYCEHIEKRWGRRDRHGWDAGPGAEQSQRIESLPDAGGEIHGQRRCQPDDA